MLTSPRDLTRTTGSAAQRLYRVPAALGALLGGWVPVDVEPHPSCLVKRGDEVGKGHAKLGSPIVALGS
jgi:hypothetical protein